MKTEPPSSNEIKAELKRLGKQLTSDPAPKKSTALEEALRAREDRFNLVFNNAAVGIAVIDTEGKFTDANDTWLDMIGYTRAELEQIGIQDVTAPGEPIIDPQIYSGEEKYQQVEKRYRRKDGQEFWGSLCAGAIEGPTGEFIGMVGVIIDITERKSVEKRLRENEEKHQTLFETMAQGVVYQDKNGKIIKANQAAQKILGLTLEQMQGRTSLDPRWRAIHEDGTEFLGESHPAMIALRTGQPVHDVVMGVFNPGIEEIQWININAIPQFKPGENEPYQVFATFCDLTDRYQVEAETRNRRAFEKAYVNISSRFIGNQDLNELINLTLEEIGRLTLAGRAYLCQFSEDGERMDNTHEWCEPNIAPEKENQQGQLTGEFPWLMSQLELDRPLLIDNIEDLPTEATSLKDKLRAKKIQAMLAIPVHGSGQLIGYLGLDYVNATKRLSEMDQTLVRITAENIGHALERHKAEHQLKQAHDWQAAIFEGSRDAIIISDEQGQIIAVNQAASSLTGHSREELLMLPLAFMHKEEGTETFHSIQNRIMAGEEITSYAKVQQKNGSVVQVESNNRRIIIHGTPYMHTVARDISRRKRAEETLRQTETRLHTILTNAPVILWSVDERGKFILSVGNGLETLGLSPDEVVGQSVYEVYKDVPAIINDVEKALKGKSFSAVHKTNGTYFETRFAPLSDANGKIEGCIGISIDITERKTIEDQLTYLATHDPLTGLPNRMAFNDRLSLALSIARRNQGQLAILLLDLDNFKDVNDTLGHDSGDELLKEAGVRLRDIVRKHDIVARMGGDEFMLLITEFGKIEDAQIIAEKILEAFRTPFQFNGQSFNITTSIGIATFPQDGNTSEDLKKHADIAMYRAKDLGRDKFQFYS